MPFAAFPRRSDQKQEGSERTLPLLGFQLRMPLQSDDEPGAGQLDRLDHPVLRPRRDPEPGPRIDDRLEMGRAGGVRALAQRREEPARRVDPHGVGGQALERNPVPRRRIALEGAELPAVRHRQELRAAADREDRDPLRLRAPEEVDLEIVPRAVHAPGLRGIAAVERRIDVLVAAGEHKTVEAVEHAVQVIGRIEVADPRAGPGERGGVGRGVDLGPVVPDVRDRQPDPRGGRIVAVVGPDVDSGDRSGERPQENAGRDEEFLPPLHLAFAAARPSETSSSVETLPWRRKTATG